LVKNVFQRIVINADLLSTLLRITFSLLGGDRTIIDYNIIKLDFRSVPFDGFQMLPRRVVVSFTRLSHQVTNENPGGAAFTDSLGNARDEQIRQDAGVKRTRT